MMPATFATIWLSRCAIIAAVIFAYCAWMAYSMDRTSGANRVAVVFNAVFALWAGAASFWYATPDAATAFALYKAFSWTWCVFPPLILHFTLRLAGFPLFDSPKRLLLAAALYLPSIALSLLLPSGLLAAPIYRGGYWMLAVARNALYLAFVVHYFVLIIAAIAVALVSGAKASGRRAKKRFVLLACSYLAAGGLGFITDTVFLFMGLDFPNLAIFWIQILSIGMIVAMRRYGFLSVLPSSEALVILENMAEFVFYVDDSGRVIWANASAVSAIGASSLGEARGAAAFEFLPPDMAARLGKLSEAGYEPRGYRSAIGPQAIPVNLWIRAVKEQGTDGAVLTAVDLRPDYANARIESRLADAGLLLDEFIARSLDGIVLVDNEGKIIRWNYPMVAMTGIEAAEAIGAPYWDIRSSVEPERAGSTDRFKEMTLSVLAGDEHPWTRRVHETEIWRRDGGKRLIQNDSFPIPLAEGTILATIARDVTEERRLADENIERIRKLDHAQKMEAVGTLSGGIAHDFNNTLAGIIGAASLIRQGMETGSVSGPIDISRELEMIERSAKRAASSVKRLLTLTRKRSPESLPFRLDESLERVASFAERSVDQSVSIDTRSPLPEATVLGDAGQVEQLALNLIINAEHAMTIMRPKGQVRGGTVFLALYAFRPDKAFLMTNPSVIEADYWALSVRDEGVGIPRHIQNRIFNPFYTTKPVDSSSGLGLAMVHAIARQHGGFVDIISEPGAGAEFLVYLPSAASEAAVSRKATQTHAGSGLALVADDDDIPRETAVAILEALGYRASAAMGGDEALRLFEENPDAWKVAILDLRMGDIGGEAVAKRIRRLRPDLPIVFASGMHDDSDDRSYGVDSAFAVLQKPYTIDELGKAIDIAFA